MSRRIFTVSEVANDLKALIEDNFPLLWITGELANCKHHSSGHFYFSIKDEAAVLTGVMWRSQVVRLKFRPEDGMKVIIAGKLSFYPPQGKTQVYAEQLEPDGVGALQLAFEQLKKKLEAEGLFAEERKRKLPLLPRKVGIITSETGAVIHDLMQNIHRRYPKMDIVFAPAKVQGDGAAEDIAEKISWMNKREDIDVLIVGRGGGSLEDLWAFNEEVVARAIFSSRIPIVSAVGHESDFTIADFVADVRASTPTAAAELAVPVLNDLLYTVDQARQGLIYAWRQCLRQWRERLRYSLSHVREPRQYLLQSRKRLEEGQLRLGYLWAERLGWFKERHLLASQKLAILSPLAILERGYAIVFKEGQGLPVKGPAEVQSGEGLNIRLAHGALSVKVK